MLTQFFESAKTFVSTLTTDQLVAIFIAVLAISCAVKLIKTGLSVILYIIGLLAVLYFFAPGLYYELFEFLGQLWHTLIG